MKKKGIIIGLIIFIISIIMKPDCTSYAMADEELDLTGRLEKKVISLDTVEAGNGFQDMMELKEILKDKEIIGMGEATHGTREFFQMKHRMFEFLVEEMDYKIFVIEAEFGGAQKVNEYILYNKGSLSEAISAMKFWTWSTEEVAEMITWMKEYNDEQDDENKKIRFYGMDMQSMDNSAEYVSGYIGKVEENPNKFKSALKKISDEIENKSLEELKEEIEIFNELMERFKENQDVYILKSSQDEYDINFQHMNVINQSIEYKNHPIEGDGFTYRDKHMAGNVQWIQNFEKNNRGNDKLMIWAHNGHVEKFNPRHVTLGNNLYDYYGDKYYSVAFDFLKGGFRAVDSSNSSSGSNSSKLKDFTMESKGERILALEFEKLNSNLFIFDFRQAMDDEVIKEWFSEPKYIMTIGALFNEKFKYFCKEEITPLVNYDAIIFVEETTAARGYNVSSYGKLNGQNEKGKILIIFAIGILAVGVVLFVAAKKKMK